MDQKQNMIAMQDAATGTMAENAQIISDIDTNEDQLPTAEEELAQLFAEDVQSLTDDAALSEDLSGFANGFPNWDLHPIRS